jgi:hypothetical protein
MKLTDHAALGRSRASRPNTAGPDFRVTFTLDGDQLMARATNQPAFSVFPESQTRFSGKEVDAEVEFFTDDRGRARYMILHQYDKELKGVKK